MGGCGVLGGALVEGRAGADEGVLGIVPEVAVVRFEQLGELGAQALMLGCPFGLAAQLREAGFDFLDDERDAVDVVPGCGQAILRLADLHAEALHVRRFVKERAALVGRHAQDLVDEPLAHDRVAVLADIALHEQVDHVAQAHTGAVQEVLRVTVAVDAAGDLDLGEIDREPAFLVVEGEDDFGHAYSGAFLRTREDDVFLLLGAEEAAALFAEDPADGVGDVALAGPIRPDDGRHTATVLEGGPVGEALEALDGEPLEVHGASPPPAIGR